MSHFLRTTLSPALASFLVLSALFMMAEPAISLGATSGTSQFTISQSVTAELSFTNPASNVTMSPSLGGLTGGTANGAVQVAVTTNSHLGYQMTLTASSSAGMIGIASSSNSIPAYVPSATNVPDYTFTTPVNTARFGYTIEATTTTDVAQAFRDNGSNACNNAAATDTVNACWLNASTTAFTIINRNFQTPQTGASTTVKFRVVISANPSPVIPDDTYVATTTLTATAN